MVGRSVGDGHAKSLPPPLTSKTLFSFFKRKKCCSCLAPIPSRQWSLKRVFHSPPFKGERMHDEEKKCTKTHVLATLAFGLLDALTFEQQFRIMLTLRGASATLMFDTCIVSLNSFESPFVDRRRRSPRASPLLLSLAHGRSGGCRRRRTQQPGHERLQRQQQQQPRPHRRRRLQRSHQPSSRRRGRLQRDPRSRRRKRRRRSQQRRRRRRLLRGRQPHRRRQPSHLIRRGRGLGSQPELQREQLGGQFARSLPVFSKQNVTFPAPQAGSSVPSSGGGGGSSTPGASSSGGPGVTDPVTGQLLAECDPARLAALTSYPRLASAGLGSMYSAAAAASYPSTDQVR